MWTDSSGVGVQVEPAGDVACAEQTVAELFHLPLQHQVDVHLKVDERVEDLASLSFKFRNHLFCHGLGHIIGKLAVFKDPDLGIKGTPAEKV